MNRPAAYLAVLAALIAVLLPAAQWAIGEGSHWWLGHRISDAQYAAWLDDAEIGCQTLEGKRPDLLLVGNSGAHAAFDARKIQARLPGFHLGDCRLGGTTIRTFGRLLERLERNEEIPKVLMLGVNQEFLFSGLSPEAELRSNNQYTQIMVTDWRFQAARRLIWGALGKSFINHRPSQLPSLAGIDAAALNAALIEDADRHAGPWPLFWRGAANMGRSARIGIDGEIKTLCDFADRHHMRVIAVQTPLPPVTMRIYAAHVGTHMNEALEKLKACATVITGEKTFDGITVAHFLQLNGPPLPTDLPGLKARVDGNHINPVGAALFTDHLLEIIGPELDQDSGVR